MDDANVLNMEKEFELKTAKAEVERLTNIITKQEILLKEYGYEGTASAIPDEEAIVVRQLSLIRSRSDQMELDADDVKKLESLVKSLHSIRQKNPRKVSKDFAKKASAEDLLNVAMLKTATDENE